MRTTTIRVTEDTHRTLQALAKATGQPLHEVVARAVDLYEERRFWAEANEAYARVWSDPETAAAERAERALWDATLGDGLEEFPYEEAAESER